jgi:hypothetical protein
MPKNKTKRITLLLTVIATSLSVLFLQLVVQESQKPDTLYGYLKASVMTGEPKPVVKPPPPPPPPPVTTTTTTTTKPATTTTTVKPATTTTTRSTRTTTTRTTRTTTTTVKPPAAVVETASFLLDTDNDSFTDRTEIRLSTDPHNAYSKPADTNNNGISDTWEQKYGVQPENGEQDTDSDGLSDKVEYFYSTDPTKSDTDGDSFSDSREVLELGTDPNNPSDPGNIDKLGIRITNIEQEQLFSDPQPFIKGVAPANGTVKIIAVNSKKVEKVLGRAQVSENELFFLVPSEPLEDGEYDLITRLIQTEKPLEAAIVKTARAQDTSQSGTTQETGEKVIAESKPVHIKVDKGLNVVPPTPQKLSDSLVTEENFIRDLRVEIIDNKPVLFGKTMSNSEVTATWNSIVLTSAIIADSPVGDFSITPFQSLGAGNHEVYLEAVRLKDNATSKTIKLPFTIVNEQPAENLKPSSVESATTQAPSAPGQTAQTATSMTAENQPSTSSGFPWIPVIIVTVLALGGGTAYFLKNRKKQV